MKSTLYLKFIIIYIIFGFLSFFLVATLTSQLLLSRIQTSTYTNLYQEANLIATNYLPDYFREGSNTDTTEVRTQLDAMKLYTHASFWFVDTQGKILVSSPLADTTVPTKIENFNPTENGTKRYQVGCYHDCFVEDVITVLAPVVQGFTTKGYLLIHKPYQDITKQRDLLLQPIYISAAVIYFFSFIILSAIQFFVFRPLRNITAAAKQYASGNLTYKIPVHTTDEMGYLSASLNYMATQIQDMEDYQKKFIANVSHDFRSPLTSIRGYVEAIADGTIPPELQGKYLKIISFETERLTELTKDLLTLNEFDTKELLLDKSSFDIQEMIKHTAVSFEGICTEKKISIEVLLLPDSPFVYADHRKIQQVLYNLLDNAIKFSPNDSVITIEITRKNDKIFVSVKDAGIGIPSKEISKIWDRFYKSDLSRGKDKKGTGLGLSIVKEIISAHDEHINVISTEGVGTEFIFSLSTK